MKYKIADLITQIPAAGGLSPRCKEYLISDDPKVDIVIHDNCDRLSSASHLTAEEKLYLETGIQFYLQLLNYSGMMLHASAVEKGGLAYLFSGPCGRGKSTHTRLWQQVFGDGVQVINDDKPALRRIDGKWYVYGTPWCGKDGINKNMKVPLGGVCFLVQANHNKIRRLDPKEALTKVLSQTTHKLKNPEKMMTLLSMIEMLIQEIPIFELENRPEPEAAILSYEIMHSSAKENGK